MEHQSGIVALTGQPNVGKSTILNGLLGEKIAIISKKPETTRDNIKGIYTEKGLQIVFVDTPGIHKPHDLLGKVMLSRAQSTLLESDIILFITEKNKAFDKDDINILNRLPDPVENKKVFFVINKVDRVKLKNTLLPLMKEASERYPFTEIVPICALKRKDLDHLLSVLKKHLPEGPQLYPEDDITDRDFDFLIKEIIREKILEETHEEVPHSIAVSIDDTKRTKDHTKIYATVYVERTSQKSIIIGKNGTKLKKIGSLAREDIEKLVSKHIYLDLWVKVFDKWKKDPKALEEFGYID